MTAVLGFGAKFYLANASGTLTEVGDILGVNRPNPSQEAVDSTTHGSAGGVREFIAGLVNAGTLSIRHHYVPGSAADTLLLAAFNRTRRTFEVRVVEEDGTTQSITGTCVPTSYDADEVVIDNKMTAVFNAQVSGATTQGATA